VVAEELQASSLVGCDELGQEQSPEPRGSPLSRSLAISDPPAVSQRVRLSWVKRPSLRPR
jgi:hypothetical protein